MSAEINKNTPINKGDGPTEQNRPDLFKQKYGRKVLRQLTPDELEIQPAEVVTIQEGFKVHGINETTLIRSLQSLDGTPIRELETRMRPAAAGLMGIPGAQRGGISMNGFMGVNESLLQVLADDNDAVLSMDLDHQQLADFLDYFSKAGKVGYGEFSYYGRQNFEYNGRTYAFWADVYRGMQDSPFNDGTATNCDYHLVCMEDGSSLDYSGLLPEMIHRYGFYEGKGTGYRVDPKRIAEVAGFTPKAENDPVAALVKDHNAVVEIKTPEQLGRLYNLEEIGMNVMQSPNYRIVTEDVNILLTFLGLFGRKYHERNREVTDAQAAYMQHITARLVTDNLVAQPFRLEWNSYTIFTNVVPEDFPQLEQVILQSVQSFDLATKREDEFAVEQFLKSCLRAISEKQEDGSENPHKAYFAGLLQRAKNNPEAVLKIYDTAARLYTPGYTVIGGPQPKTDTEKVHALAEALDTTLPTLKDEVIRLYKQLRMPISDDVTLEQLLLSKESMENYKKAVNAGVDFARRIGGLKRVSESDMGTLLRVLVSGVKESQQYSNDELAAMERLNVDPNLIPYAFKAAGAARPSADMVIAQLYNGVAKREQDLERALTQLPANMDGKAREAAQSLIKGALGSYSTEKIDVQELISRLNTKAAELEKRRDTQEAGHAVITEADVLNEYLGLLLPPFRDLFASSLVKKALKKDILNPIEVTLDSKALATIPEIEVKSEFGLRRKVRIVEIGDQQYVIDEFGIKQGDFSLRLDRNKVSLYMSKGRRF